MKKILITLALAALCGGLSLQASPVSPEKALDVARKILTSQSVTRAGSGDISIIWDGEFAKDAGAKRDVVQPAFYVVARDGGGWVMIAGDDNVRPVLGLSTDGEFKTEGMPDNVRFWMDMTKAYVRSATVQESGVDALWAKFIDTKADASISGTVTPIYERYTPTWDQGNNDPWYFGSNTYIFNSQCPTYGGNYCVTGCVPLALGELLTYESGTMANFPTSASGSVGGYITQEEYDNGIRCPNPYDLSAVYDWSGLRGLMTISAVGSASSDLKNNLARLLADLGAIVEAKYTVGGTSAVNQRIIGHMIDHFGLNKAATMRYASEFTPRQWVEELREELRYRPVLYSGRTLDDDGHAFLLDACGTYDNETVFHVNFGWGGSNNGFYYITNLNTGQNGNYSYRCAAYFDFYPDASSEYPVKLEAYYMNADYPGIRWASVGENKYRCYFSVGNMGNATYNGQIKFCIKDKNGNEAVITTMDFNDLLPGKAGGQGWGNVTISGLSFGDCFVYYYLDGEEWKQLDGQAGSVVAEWPVMPAAFIYTKSSYSVGDAFMFRLKNYDKRYLGTVWTITYPDGHTESIPQSSCAGIDLNDAGKYKIEAALAETVGDTVTETVVTYITVANNN